MKNNFKIFTVSSVICTLGLFSNVAQAQANMDQGGLSVRGAPSVAAPATEEKKLQHWDPSKPLTVGDMSELHRAKLTEEFLVQHGFTSAPPPKPVLTQEKAKPLPKPPHILKVHAIYGAKTNLAADVEFNGSLHTVKDGYSIFGEDIAIKFSKDMNGKLAANAEKLPEKNCKPRKKVSCESKKLGSIPLATDETVEWNR